LTPRATIRSRSIFGLYPVTDEQTLVDFAA
jgi:hypothetical protein